MSIEQLNLVLQKEYLIIDPTNTRPLLGTESVRSCCGIFIYHPLRSAVLHWDDNCCHEDLDKFVKEYLDNTINLKECTVTLIGGWTDNIESKKSGDFVKQYFEHSAGKLNLDHFQKKKSKGSLAEQGFSLIYIDVRTGKVRVSDNWSKLRSFDDNKYRGTDPIVRDSSRNLQDLIHLQNDKVKNSGSHIYERDRYQELHNQQSTKLCISAQKNDIPALIKLLDEGITGLNEAPAHAKGWTPLHYACKFKHYEAALLLIQNGADLLQKNEAGNTPLSFIDSNLFEYKKLQTAYRLVKFNTSNNLHSLTSISLFARHHEEQINVPLRKKLTQVEELLKTNNGLSIISNMLPSGF